MAEMLNSTHDMVIINFPVVHSPHYIQDPCTLLSDSMSIKIKFGRKRNKYLLVRSQTPQNMHKEIISSGPSLFFM